MTPATEPGQTTLENRLRVRPMTWSHVYRDYWGAHVTAMEAIGDHSALEVEATSTVERSDATPLPHRAAPGRTSPTRALLDRQNEYAHPTRAHRPGRARSSSWPQAARGAALAARDRLPGRRVDPRRR